MSLENGTRGKQWFVYTSFREDGMIDAQRASDCYDAIDVHAMYKETNVVEMTNTRNKKEPSSVTFNPMFRMSK